jgi:hypothetical protein
MKKLLAFMLTFAVLSTMVIAVKADDTIHVITFDNETWQKSATFTSDDFTVFCHGTQHSEIADNSLIPATIVIPTVNDSQGYFFCGYYTQPNGAGILYYDSEGVRLATARIAEDTMLYAHWVRTENVINFYDNVTIAVIVGERLPLRIMPPERPDYVFLGVYSVVSEDEKLQIYSSIGGRTFNDIINLDNIPATATAMWEIIHFDVIFEDVEDAPENEERYPNLRIAAGEPLPQNITPPTRAGHTFTGFFDEPNGAGVQYYDVDGKITRGFRIIQDTVLFAHWTVNRYSITLNRAGGSGGTASRGVNFGQRPQAITPPTRDEYVFAGYFTERDGDGTQYFDETGAALLYWTAPADVRLFAYWVQPCLSTSNVATEIIDDMIILTWDKVEFADGYEIFRSRELLGTYELVETLNLGETTDFRVGVAFTRGDVVGNNTIDIGDALAILRYLVGLSSPLDAGRGSRAWYAALITNPNAERPQIGDALAILRKLVNLPSVLDNAVPKPWIHQRSHVPSN